MQGLGWMLMKLIIEYAREEGLKEITGQVLNENSTMIQMCRELGFLIGMDPDDPHITLVRLPIGS
jgi:acetyltransferase